MEAAIVQLVIGLIAALPQETTAIAGAYQAIKSDLSATTQAQIDAALTAANAELDADMAQLDADAAAHGT
jgi:hypothetical protein